MSRLSIPVAVAAALLLSACGTFPQAKTDAGRIGQDAKRDSAGISRPAKKDTARSSQTQPGKQPADSGDERSQVAAVTTPPPSAARFSELRQQMSGKDAELAGTALKVSMSKARDNERRGWKNNQTQTSGSVMPLRSYTGSAGQSCRDYRETLTVGGSSASSDGTACKQPDGSWAVSS